MAGNSERIDDVIAEVASKQVTDLTAQVSLLEQQFIVTAKAAIQLNNATGNSSSFRAYNTNATASAKATAQLQQAQNNAAKSAVQLQAAQARLQAQTDRQTAATQRAAAATQKSLSPYQQLSKELDVARLAAKDLGVIYGQQSEEFLNAAKSVTVLDNRLKAIDQTVGQSQRNVGNYTSAFGGLSKAYGFLRTAANIIPGIGISGFFLLAYEGITQLIKAFNELKLTQQDAIVSAKAYGEAINSDEYKGAVENVKELKINIGLAKQGFLDKNDVLKQYNDTIGKTTGFVKSLDQAEAALVKNGDAFIKMQLLKATAQVLLKQAAEEAAKGAIEQARDVDRGLYGTKQEIQAAYKGVPLLVSLKDAFNQDNKALQAYQKETVKTSKESTTQLTDIAKKFQAEAAKIAKDNKFDFFGKPDKPAKDTSTPDALRINRALVEQAKLTLESEKGSYDERIDALDTFNTASIDLIQKEGSIKLAKEGVNAKQRKAIEIETSNALVQNDLEVASKRKKINDDTSKALLKYVQDYAKELSDGGKELTKERVDRAKADSEAFLNALTEDKNSELRILAERYSSGKISQEQFNAEKLRIEQEYTKAFIAEQIKQLEAIIATKKANGEDVTGDLKSLADLKLSLDNKLTEAILSNLDKQTKKVKTLKDAEAELSKLRTEAVQAFTALADTLLNASFENQKNKVQEQSDAVDVQKQKDIDEVDRSLLSEKDKADKIAIINAKAQAQQDVLDKRKRDISVKQAKFEKAINIAKTITNIAVEEVKALDYLSNPLTAPLYPAIASIIAAVGAAQLATIIAQPIPKYATGTDYHKGGTYIAGEVGAELVIEPSGRSYLTPDSATYGIAPKGTKVIPNNKLMAMMAHPERTHFAGRQQISMDKVVEAIKGTTQAVKGSNKRPVINGWMREQMAANSWNDYKQQHFR